MADDQHLVGFHGNFRSSDSSHRRSFPVSANKYPQIVCLAVYVEGLTSGRVDFTVALSGESLLRLSPRYQAILAPGLI
jgi:hypothetical protein